MFKKETRPGPASVVDHDPSNPPFLATPTSTGQNFWVTTSASAPSSATLNPPTVLGDLLNTNERDIALYLDTNNIPGKPSNMRTRSNHHWWLAYRRVLLNKFDANDFSSEASFPTAKIGDAVLDSSCKDVVVAFGTTKIPKTRTELLRTFNDLGKAMKLRWRPSGGMGNWKSFDDEAVCGWFAPIFDELANRAQQAGLFD